MAEKIFADLTDSEIKQIGKIAGRFKRDMIDGYVLIGMIPLAVFIGLSFFLYCIYPEFGSDVIINVNAMVIFIALYLTATILCIVYAVRSADEEIALLSYYYTLGEITDIKKVNIPKEAEVVQTEPKNHVVRIVRRIKYDQPAKILFAEEENVQFESLPRTDRNFDSSAIGKESVIICYPKLGINVIILREELMSISDRAFFETQERFFC